jgi:hypothetical protein
VNHGLCDGEMNQKVGWASEPLDQVTLAQLAVKRQRLLNV